MAAKAKAKSAKADTADPPFKIQDWPAENRERRAVADIKPNAKNPKKHPQAQVEALAASYREFGVTGLILIDEKNTIIAGEGRWLAAKHAGIVEVPVAVARGWSERKKLKYLFADNQLPLLGEFSDLMRADLLRSLELKPDELAALGLDQARMLEQMAKTNEGAGDPDVAPPPPRKTPIRVGDCFILGEHRLMCGDATSEADVEALLDGDKPNLMVTDPPYGVSYDPAWRNEAGLSARGAVGKVLNDDKADWTEAWRLFTGDVAYVWHASGFGSVVQDSLAATGLLFRSQIIWAKDRFVIGRGDYHWQHEACFYAVRKGGKGWWAGGRKQSTVWNITHHVSETGHGTQKPIECMKRPIENNSRRGETVYEPFSGSGTTIIACEMTGRRARAMELDPVYVHATVERWEKFTGQQARLVTGETLDELRVQRRKRGGDAKGDSRKPVRGKRAVAPVGDPAAAQ